MNVCNFFHLNMYLLLYIYIINIEVSKHLRFRFFHDEFDIYINNLTQNINLFLCKLPIIYYINLDIPYILSLHFYTQVYRIKDIKTQKIYFLLDFSHRKSTNYSSPYFFIFLNKT